MAEGDEPKGAVSDATRIWHSTKNDPNMKSAEGLFFFTEQLFREALVCYGAGAFGATTLMCRAALEATLFNFLAHTMNEQANSWRLHLPENRAGGWRRIPMEELVSVITERKVLTDEELEQLNRIKDNGDLTAHLGERTYEALHEHITRGKSDPVGLADPLQAFRDFRDTGGILRSLARVVVEQPDKMGPGSPGPAAAPSAGPKPPLRDS